MKVLHGTPKGIMSEASNPFLRDKIRPERFMKVLHGTPKGITSEASNPPLAPRLNQ